MLRARLEHANYSEGGSEGAASPASGGGPASPSVSVMTVNERLTQKLSEATRKLADVGMLKKQNAALRRRLEKAEAHGPVVEILRKELSAAKAELGAMTSTPVFGHFSRIFQLHTTPHPPRDMPHTW